MHHQPLAGVILIYAAYSSAPCSIKTCNNHMSSSFIHSSQANKPSASMAKGLFFLLFSDHIRLVTVWLKPSLWLFVSLFVVLLPVVCCAPVLALPMLLPTAAR